jgi:hypothetical protein
VGRSGGESTIRVCSPESIPLYHTVRNSLYTHEIPSGIVDATRVTTTDTTPPAGVHRVGSGPEEEVVKATESSVVGPFEHNYFKSRADNLNRKRQTPKRRGVVCEAGLGNSSMLHLPRSASLLLVNLLCLACQPALPDSSEASAIFNRDREHDTEDLMRQLPSVSSPP